MKKIYLLSALAIFAASCSDNKNENLPSLESKTYSGLSELNLTYNGSPMVGKEATFQGGATSSLLFDSKVDLSAFSETLKGLPAIPGPGILPGSPTLELTLPLQANGDKYSFAGSGETDYVTYGFAGDITGSKLNFALRNVKLKDLSLAGGVWKPAPISSGSQPSSPFHIVWETSQPGLLEFFDGEMEDLLKLLVNLPIIPVYHNTAYMTPAQVVSSGLQTICFNPDGNLVVTYLQSANGAAQFAQAPLCMLQYLPVTERMLKLYVNPTDLISQIIINNTNKPDIPANPFGAPARRNTRGNGGESLPLSPEQLSAILQQVAPMLSEGIPMKYSRTDTSFDLYIPSEVLIPLVKNIVVPLLADPQIQALITEKLESNESLKPHMTIIKGLMFALPLILDTTTKAEIGLSFVK